MKILHISPLSPYNVGWSYQENLLPKYQKNLGNEITVVVSTFKNTKNGKKDVGENDFIVDEGIHVYRKKRFLGNTFLGKFISYTNVWNIICGFKPDLIMVHSLTTLSIFQAIKYKKKINNSCVIIQDNHLDENIGRKKYRIITDLLYKYWAFINKFSSKYVSKYYGVTEWRRQFIVDRFGIPENKTDVLIMGADLEKIDFKNKKEIRNRIKKDLNIKDDFIIITGGKIEQNKKTANLMKAVKNLKNVKLIVFGEVASNYEKEINNSINDNVIMLGWKNQQEIYNLFLASDLAIFPGQHSVLWEQACACKIPCVFAHWEGMNHLNNGGNSMEINDISSEGLEEFIEKFIYSDEYYKMKEKAQSKLTDIYNYEEIAKKSIECVNK